MPQYIYECEKCGDSHLEIHSMKEDPQIKCPKCKTICFRAVQPVRALVKGNCYLNKKDCKKQAAMATLQDNDPYKKFRQPGEKEDLISKIKNSGKKRKSFKMS